MFSDKLRTKFAGLDMRTPVSVAPHSSEGPSSIAYADHVVDRLMEYVKQGCSKVAIQYTCTENVKDYPKGKEDLLRWGTVRDSSPLAKDFRYLFIMGDEVACMGRRDVGLKVIDMLKKKVPEGVIVEADVVGRVLDPSQADSWAAIAKEFEAAGADVIELDTSCPMYAAHVDPKWAALVEEAGFPNQQIADNLEAVTELCATVNKAIKVPFGWKMTPETGWPRFLYIAKASLDNGAKWVTVTNNPLVLSPIDIYKDGAPDQELFPFGTANCLAGAVGYGRAMGRKATAALATWVPGIDIISITGITKPEYAVEYLMLGGRIVELASGIFFYGPNFIGRTVKFIERFLEEQGYDNVDQMRGRALLHTEWDGSKFDFMYGKVVARIDKDTCTSCMRCGGTICYAIDHDEDMKARVDEMVCSGCGLCVAVCPVGAAQLQLRDKPKELDLAKGLPAIGDMVKWGVASR